MPVLTTFGGASLKSYGLSLSSGGAATVVTDFDSIVTTTVGTATSTISFNSIPQTYSHLQLRCNILTSIAGGGSAKIQFNSDTGANYSWHSVYGSGATAGAGAGASSNWAYLYFTGTTTSPSANIVDILDYANANKYKTLRLIEGYDVNGSTSYVALTSGNWRSNSAITSILLTTTSGTFNVNSSFALYGITA